jgi:hypothetical protein
MDQDIIENIMAKSLIFPLASSSWKNLNLGQFISMRFSWSYLFFAFLPIMVMVASSKVVSSSLKTMYLEDKT